MEIGNAAFAFVAGVLSSLSPCVLPILPIVFGAALGQHRFGSLALALGLAASFTAAGLFIATIGFNLGLNADLFRSFGALLSIAIGAILVIPRFERQFAFAMNSVSNWGNERTQAYKGRGLWGQAGLGVLLGAVWSPCAGPALGAASLMAARGENIAAVAFVMFAFGVGAALPLVAIALLSRDLLARWRSRLMQGAKRGKALLGIFLVVIGCAVLSGADKRFEAAMVDLSPQWLTDLTTAF